MTRYIDGLPVERSGDGGKKDMAALMLASPSGRALLNDPENRAALGKTPHGRRALRMAGYAEDAKRSRGTDVAPQVETRQPKAPTAITMPDGQPLGTFEAEPVVIPGGAPRSAGHYGADSRFSMFGDMARIALAQKRNSTIIDNGGRPIGDGSDIPAPGQGTLEDARRRLYLGTREQRSVNVTSGHGGDFVAPAWFAEQFVTAARQVSKTPDLLGRADLPAKGHTIKIPKFTSAITAEAHDENASLTPTDFTSDYVTTNVVQIVASVQTTVQWLDRAGGLADLALSTDMARDIGRELDRQVLVGSGTGGELEGLLTATGTTYTTYTDASPTVAEFRTKTWAAYRDVVAAGGLEPDVMMVHPRRYAWSMAGTDSNSRQTLAVDFPARATPVGSIPATRGTGTNEDVAVLLNKEAAVLMLGAPDFRVLPDSSLTSEMVVRVVCVMYAALAIRRPESVALLTGTGMATPTL